MKRYHARKDLVLRIRDDLKSASGEFAELLPDKVEILEVKGKKFVLVEGEALVFESENGYFPTVRGALQVKDDKRTIVVDRGAVPHVINGADIMRPGVVAYDEHIEVGNYVIVREETHKKAIAICVSLWNGKDFANKGTGKCAKNLYFVGDEVWNLG